ncbi:MAG: hypothetical protein J5701_05155 [Bacteroidales bacterium]|nr:hypothetical protein [Bacteroidales bacterium]
MTTHHYAKEKILTGLLILLLITSSCKQKHTNFSTRSVNDKRCLELYPLDTRPLIEDNRIQVENAYSIVFPEKGCLPHELEHELIQLIFSNTTANTIEEAAEQFLNHTGLEGYDELTDKSRKIKRIDSITVTSYNYTRITGTCDRDDNLVTFSVYTEMYMAGAPHGYHITDMLTIDLNTRRIIHLEDLIDTTRLGEVLIRALEDVAVNREEGYTTDCLNGEYKEKLPMPDCFFIDSSRSVITAIYNIYSVQPYYCDMLFVKMPVFWLSKHIPLTPYAKQLFGPEAYLPDDR